MTAEGCGTVVAYWGLFGVTMFTIAAIIDMDYAVRLVRRLAIIALGVFALVELVGVMLKIAGMLVKFVGR